jgi:hypothetical protein
MSENKNNNFDPKSKEKEVMMIKKIQLQAKIVQLTSKSFPVAPQTGSWSDLSLWPGWACLRGGCWQRTA